VWTLFWYGRSRGLGRLIFKDGFRHVVAFSYAGGEKWLWVDPRSDRLGLEVLGLEDHARRLRALDGLRAARVDIMGAGSRGLAWPTCAGEVARIVGLPGALRPEGLWRSVRCRRE
jgi:hypothetical protein